MANVDQLKTLAELHNVELDDDDKKPAIEAKLEAASIDIAAAVKALEEAGDPALQELEAAHAAAHPDPAAESPEDGDASGRPPLSEVAEQRAAAQIFLSSTTSKEA